MLWRSADRHLLRCWPIVAAVFLGATAHAQSPSGNAAAGAPTGQPSDAQLSAAREFYARGEKLYVQGRYDAAWVEFSSAYQIAPLPELLFNLARTEEKLNRTAAAAKHYREFLEKSPGDPDADKIRATIARLEHPNSPAPGALASSSSGSGSPETGGTRRLPLYSIIAGSGTLLFTIIGAAALGSARMRYDALAGTCAPNCPTSDLMPLQQTIQTGQAFISLAAIGAAGTAGLLVWELRRGRSGR